jgi:hypothetical protein
MTGSGMIAGEICALPTGSRNGASNPVLFPQKRIEMKTTVAALVILLSSFVSAQTSHNSSAGGNFVTPDRLINGFVEINRTQDVKTKVVTTELFYRLCSLAGTVVNCQIGNGRIPASALIGDVYAQSNRPDTIRVLVDTSTIEGSSGCEQPGQTPCFSNFICFGHDEFDNCNGGQGPAIGGLVSVSWTRTNASETIISTASKVFDFGKLTAAQSFLQYVFSANQTGTVVGAAVRGSGFMATSTDSETLKNAFEARKRTR